MGEYRYTECGLDNVLIEGMNVLVDDGGEKSITIPNINGLHRVIALGIVRRKNSISGKELRYLRTEMGMTQAKLAEMVHCEPLTISRWERGEYPIDATAETLIRVCATQELGLPTDTKVSEISGWCVQGPAPQPLIIDGADPSNYRLKKAA
jgi:transcriptional regulator with XRE-family HTH domain